VRVFFAQYKAAGPKVEHVVVMRMSYDSVHFFLKSMEASVVKTGGAFLAQIQHPSSPPVDRDSVPNQTFTLDANIIVAGYSGREACMDLYYSSPQVKVALKRGGNEFRAEPVARVMLTTRLLIDIYEELAAKTPTISTGETVEVEVQDE